MRRAGGAWAVLAAALVSHPSRANAVSLTGSGGVTYERSDTLEPAPAFTVPSWSWYGDLALSGLPIRPELLSASASASYAAHRSIYEDGGSAANAWSYQGNASLLSAFPLRLTLSARHGWGDNASGRDLVPVGERLSTDYGGTATFNLRGYPFLSATVVRSTATIHTLATPTIVSESTTLHTGGGQSLGPLRYGFSYDTSWNTIDNGQGDHRVHNLGVEADADVSEHVRFSAADRYYLRLPTGDSPYNPRLDGHNASATLALRETQRVTASASYRYSHLLAQTSTSLAELVSNQAVLDGGYRFTSEWTGHGGVVLGEGVARTSAESRRDLGASLRAGGGWDPTFGGVRMHATADANVGRVLSGNEGALAYGVKASVDAGGAAGRARLSAGYGAGYQRNAVALAGSTVAQDAHLRADGSAWGIALSSVLTGELARRTDRLLGTSTTRSATWTHTASTRAASLALALGYQEGFGDVADRAIVQGLPIPPTLNSRTRYASLTGSGHVGAVRVAGEARVSDWVAPDRPPERETRLLVRATHVIGKLQLRLEDRYTVASTIGAQRRGNVLFLTAARAFEIL